MPAFNRFNSFVQALGEEKHKLDTDVLKLVFSNTAPSASNTVLANITQIASGAGYTQMSGGSGGVTLDGVTWTNSSGVSKLSASDEVFTASGGTTALMRYVVLVNETAPNDELIGWWDYGSSFQLADGEPLTVDFDGTNGILTLQ